MPSRRVALASLFALGLVACGAASSSTPPAAPGAPAGPTGPATGAPTTPAAGAAAGATAGAQPLKAPGDAKIGDRTSCPISGEEFVVTADSPKSEYNGKTYYFCCPHCKAKFESSPGKFAKGA